MKSKLSLLFLLAVANTNFAAVTSGAGVYQNPGIQTITSTGSSGTNLNATATNVFLGAGPGISIGTNNPTYWTISSTISNAGGINFTNSKVVYVDPNGNDSTAVRGYRNLPYKNIEVAASNALAGDTIIVSQGTYITTNGIFLPKGGVTLRGEGMPVIQTYATNGTNLKRFGVVLTDNCIVENFAISNMLKSLEYQMSIGYHNNLNWGTTLTNVVLRNLVLDGDSDGLFIKASNTVQLAMYDVRAYSKWDAMVIIAESGYTPVIDWKLFNCVSVIYTESVFNPGMSLYTHCLGVDATPNARVFISGGYYASTNNSVGYVFYNAGNCPSFELRAQGATFVGTNWFKTQDMTANTWKIRATGCQIEGKFINGSLDTIGDTQVYGDVTWGLANSLYIMDSPALGPNPEGNLVSTWTNTWGSDGGLMLGGTNLVGKSKLRVVGSARFQNGITNDVLTPSTVVFTDNNKRLTSTGVVDATNGGTGFTTYYNTNLGGLLYVSGTNTASAISITLTNGGLNNVLHRSGAGFGGIASGIPYWGSVLNADIGGTISLAKIAWGDNFVDGNRAIVTDVNLQPQESVTTDTEIAWLHNRTGTIVTNVTLVAGTGVTIVTNTANPNPKWTISSTGGSLGYLTYVAIISQTSSDPTVIATLVNTLGVTPTFTKASAGYFQVTASGVLTINKTYASCTPGYDGGDGAIIPVYVELDFSGNNYFHLRTNKGTLPTDGLLSNCLLEIRVYP